MSSLRPVFSALLLVACASGGGGTGTDAGRTPTDGGPETDSGSMSDAGSAGCPPGRHACGAGCIDDLENLPENGCRFGCGEACPTLPGGMAACDAAGACTLVCVTPFRLQGGVCVCDARTCEDLGHTCGSPDDGCGLSLDCGSCGGSGTCLDGTCSCSRGPEEPNDTPVAAPHIASLTDAPDSNEVFTTFGIHAMDDDDWFEVSVADDFDAGNPQITVTLRDIPAGDDYDLAAYFICDAGGDSTRCTRGIVDNMIGRGCASATRGVESVELATECSTTDETGSLLIHITTTAFGGMCGNYELEVDVR